MQELRSLIRSLSDRIPLLAGVLLVSALATGCAPGSATRLVGVGCSDPSCEHEEPQTARVLGCVGDGCNEPAPPDVGSTGASTAASGAGDEAAPAAEPKAAPPAAAGAEKSGEAPADAKKDESSDWKVKVYYEPFQRD